jgi:hypothetical protein
MQELALSCAWLHLSAAAGVELAALRPDGIGGAATSHGQGVLPGEAAGGHPAGSQKFCNNCTGKIAVESPNAVSFRFDVAGNALAKSTFINSQKQHT